MALVVCSSCNCHAESNASACPHCGAVLSSGKHSAPSRAALALGLVLGMGTLGGCPVSQPLYGTVVTDLVKTGTGETAETGDTGAEETTE